MGGLRQLSYRHPGGTRLAIQLGRHPAALQGRPVGSRLVVEHVRVSRTVSREPDADWLQRWLSIDAIQGRDARLILPSERVEHVLVQVPAGSMRAREAAIETALAPAAARDARRRVWAATGHETKGAEHALVAVVDRADVDRACGVAAEAGLRVVHVTTALLALAGLARRGYGRHPSVALLCLESTVAWALHLERGTPRAVAQLGIGASDSGGPTPVDVLVVELDAWLRERESVARVVLAGSLPDLDTLVVPLHERLPVAVELFELEGLVDFEGATAGRENARHTDGAARAGTAASPRFGPAPSGLTAGQRASLAAPIGTLGLAATTANLLPSEVRARPREQLFVRLAGAAIVGACVLLLGMAMSAALDAGRYRRELASLRERVAMTLPGVEEARAIELARERNLARRALVEDRIWEPALIAAGLRRIALAAPEALRLEAIDWQQPENAAAEPLWNAHVRGTVEGATAASAQAGFNRFFADLLVDPLVHDVRLIEPLVVETAETPARPEAPVGIVRFTVAVELVAPPRAEP